MFVNQNILFSLSLFEDGARARVRARVRVCACVAVEYFISCSSLGGNCFTNEANPFSTVGSGQKSERWMKEWRPQFFFMC